MAFGRMNPPTVGHGQLIDTVARSAGGGDYFIFVSHTQDKKKNPLDYATKIGFIKSMFPGRAKHIISDSSLRTIMQIAAWLYAKGYRKITMVAGSDRLDNFSELLHKYNGVEKKHGFYKFNTIKVHSAGKRDPDAEDITGLSATKMRQAAHDGDREMFHANSPSAMSEKDKDGMMKDVVKGRKKINEEVVGSVDARGLGFVTGVPAVQGSEIANYVEKNTADSDQKDNILKTFKKFHIDHHTKIFKSFLDKK